MPSHLARALRVTVSALLLTALVLPVGPSTASIPIENYPTYQPQTSCSPSPKKGTQMLATYLQRRYRGTGSSGISRSCGTSGVSEHKEGRAFDWRVSAASARDRRYVQNFLTQILATDRAGNRNALARRMGIMYVIWNDRIWSASRGYRMRAYRHPACSTVKGCGTTLRHRDHVHISLTHAGAQARTSWYVKRLGGTPAPTPRPPSGPTAPPATPPATTPPPAPRPATQPADDGVLDLSRRAYTRVVVPTDGTTVETPFKLRQGTTYTVTAAGLYNYGTPLQVGDAVCTWSRRRPTWSATPAPLERRAFGRLVLAANERPVFAGSACRRNHTYRTRYTATATAPLRLSVLGGRPGGSGTLRLVISKAGADVSRVLPSYPDPAPAPAPAASARGGYGMLTETVTVPASSSGVRSLYGLEPGAEYRVTVEGVVGLGGGVFTDGRCLSVRGTWYPSASLDLRNPSDDHGDLFVNGVRFPGTSAVPGAAGCGSSHSAVLTASDRGRLGFTLWDPFSRADNTGVLTARVQRLSPVATPARGPRALPQSKARWLLKREDLTVPSNQAAGVLSEMRVRQGETVRVLVSGTIRSHGVDADASCVRTSGGWLPSDPLNALAVDPLELWVDGQAVRWRPSAGSGACSANGSYWTRIVAAKNGPLRLGVLDLDHRDNKGALRVTLVRLR